MSPACSAHVFHKEANCAEMPGFRCVADCKLQMCSKWLLRMPLNIKDGEVFKVLKKIGEKGYRCIPNCKMSKEKTREQIQLK